MLHKGTLRGQVPVLWSDAMGHVDQEPSVTPQCQPLSVILHSVLSEGGSSGLHGEDVHVQTPRPLHGGSETRKYMERVPEGPRILRAHPYWYTRTRVLIPTSSLVCALAGFSHDAPCWPDHWGTCWPVMLKPGSHEFMAHFWLQANLPGRNSLSPLETASPWLLLSSHFT